MTTHTAQSPSLCALVVDDNAMDRFIVREALEQIGLDVVEACDGEEALRCFAQCRPDLVLLDVKMPKMNGYECCRRLREHDDNAHLPILMLTGLNDDESIESAYEMGATDFFAKPINVAVLGHRARYLLRSSLIAQQLHASRSQLANAQRMAGFGHWQWSERTGKAQWSPEVENMLGCTPVFTSAEKSLNGHVHSDDRLSFENALSHAISTGEVANLEHRIIVPANGVRTVQHVIEASLAPDGALDGLSGVIQDVTSHREAQERVRYLAYYDTVTGLPNRALLVEHLTHALSQANRQDTTVAVLFLDLDRFKRINDTLGHNAGDALLAEVAGRLQQCTRSCDYVATQREPPASDEPGHRHTVARLGGDEFVVVLTEVRRPEDAARVASRIKKSLLEPFTLAGQSVQVSTSIGISSYPADGGDVESLLKHADAAMYCAKAAGRDRYEFFTAEMNERTARRLELEAALRDAIALDQLCLHYQPIVSLTSGKTTAVEALVRWERPGHGLIPPVEFISVAEETRLIVPLGNWVLQKACADLARLADKGLSGFRVAVNLSAVQFAAPGLCTTVAEALAAAGLSSDCLELELTETVLMEDARESVATLAELKNLGIRIAVDDFGTGYSSLSYLKRFPIDTLKIDQSFIRDVVTDGDDATIVMATVNLARSLNLDVVAEGVEEPEQLEFLTATTCDACQGYLLAKPMPFYELQEWLKKEDTVLIRPAA